MRDASRRPRSRRRSRPPLPQREATREVRLLSLSEGLSFCLQLRAQRDPRFQCELARWLAQARRDGGLGREDAELLGAAVVAVEGAFRDHALQIVERARGQLFAPTSRVKTHVRSTTKVAAILAASLIVAGTGVMNARGDPSLVRPLAAPMFSDRAFPARTAIARPRCPIPSRLRVAFVTASNSTGLPISLLVAVAHTESHFDGSARSGAGAVGVLQLMPDTARALGADPADPEANVLAGARYLRSLYSRFGSFRLAIAA